MRDHRAGYAQVTCHSTLQHHDRSHRVTSARLYFADTAPATRQSLRVLEAAKAAVPTLVTKSSIMLGLGETTEEARPAFSCCLPHCLPPPPSPGTCRRLSTGYNRAYMTLRDLSCCWDDPL